MALLLGAIADDVTGATDLAACLTRHGMRVVQTLGVPRTPVVPDADAIVVALKTRTVPAAEAVSASLDAASWLRAGGARQLFFKYCSTFDSTDAGNIGPVAEALLDQLGAQFTIACPAYPGNRRTVYLGHLFVGSALLSESGMRDHPLTPMRDANLVRVLQRQCRGSVGLVPFADVEAGPETLRTAFERLRSAGTRIAIVDALTDSHLTTIGQACGRLPLVTGGSGVAAGLPENFRAAGLLPVRQGWAPLPATPGPVLVLAGSCSEATRAQVAAMASRYPAIRIDPVGLARTGDALDAATASLSDTLASGPATLVYSTAGPEDVRRAQAELGAAEAAAVTERALASLAVFAVRRGVRILIVAGGDTSGRVAAALGLTQLRIGPEIAPGVPWTIHEGDPGLLVAFKSGNFGGPTFFTDAMETLPKP